MAGWIKLQRAIKDHWIWKDPVKLKWWIDLLITVNHSPAKVNIGNQLFECGRGQSIQSLSNWAKQWGVSKDKARNFFVLLEKDGMISHEVIGKTTRITICNYDTYQCDLHDSQTIEQQSSNDEPTIAHTNKKNKKKNNDENDKEIGSKRFVRPTIQEIKDFISENSFSVNAESFFNYYEANGWMVGRSKMKSWQAAIRNWNSKDWRRNKQKDSPKREFEMAGSDSMDGFETTL